VATNLEMGIMALPLDRKGIEPHRESGAFMVLLQSAARNFGMDKYRG